jgi:hypothetical protein
MEKDFRDKVRRIYRLNRMLWIAIFSGMLLLNLFVVIFDYYGIVSGPSVKNIANFDNLTMGIILMLTVLILYVKRNYLQPKKIVERAKKKDLSIIPDDVRDLLQEFGSEGDIMAKSLLILRRYFMLIWSLANLIIILAFVDYIVALTYQSFWIYSIVGLYSMVINFPKFDTIEALHYWLSD